MYCEFAEELRAKRKKQLKKDTASKIKSLVDEVCEVLIIYLSLIASCIRANGSFLM